MPQDSALPFPAQLKRARRAAGLTQAELAARAGFSVVFISMLERGTRQPIPTTLALLADALDLYGEERLALTLAAGLSPEVSPHARRTQLPPSRRTVAPAPHLPFGGFLGALPDGQLVAREAEMEVVLAAIEHVAGGNGRVALLAGEPGVGKTRLAQEAMVAARERGFLVATGRCYAPRQAVAYYPFLEALTIAHAAAPSELQADVARRWPEVTRLLPDVTASAPAVALSSSRRDDQQRLVWQVTGFLQALAESNPVALLLDDLHWADSASLDLLQHVARHTYAQRILLIGTYRDTELHRQHPLSGALRDLQRDQLALQIDVRRLSEDGTRTLVTVMLGADAGTAADVDTVSDEFVRLLFARTEGNPFFTREVLRSLLARGEGSDPTEAANLQALAELELPESIRSVIEERLARLSPVTREVLREASVLGQTFAFGDLVALGDRREEEVENALDEACVASLTHEVGRETYTFHHALIQQALYCDLSTRKRRRLHRAAGEAIERMPERKREARVVELASHFLEADEGARALPYALRAGDQAEAVYAHTEAERHYRVALRVARQLAGEEAAGGSRENASPRRAEAEARFKLGTTLRFLARYDEALDHLLGAERFFRDADDVEARAGVLQQLIQAYVECGRVADGREHFEAVAAELEGGGASLRTSSIAHNGLGVMLTLTGHLHDGLDALRRAEAQARAAVDTRLLALAQLNVGVTLITLGRHEEARRTFEELAAVAERAGDLHMFALAVNNLGAVFEEIGDMEAAYQAYGQAVEIAERAGDVRQRAAIWIGHSDAAFALGRWSEAGADVERAAALVRHAPSSDAARSCLIRRARRDAAEGRREAALAALEAIVAARDIVRHLDDDGRSERLLSELDLVDRRPQAAQSRLYAVLSTAPNDFTRTAVTQSMLAWSLMDLGQLDAAEALSATAVEHARRAQRPADMGEVLRVGAMVLMRRGRQVEAEAALREALALARSMPCPWAEAKTLYVYGQLHAERGESEAARETYQVALAICERLGEGLYRPHIERALTELGG